MWYDSRYDECHLFKKVSCTSIIKITVYFTFKCTTKFLKFLIQTIIYVCSMTPFGSLTSLITYTNYNLHKLKIYKKCSQGKMYQSCK